MHKLKTLPFVANLLYAIHCGDTVISPRAQIFRTGRDRGKDLAQFRDESSEVQRGEDVGMQGHQ